jgi:hypothetical protein
VRLAQVEEAKPGTLMPDICSQFFSSEMSVNPQVQSHDPWNARESSLSRHFIRTETTLLQNECLNGQYRVTGREFDVSSTPLGIQSRNTGLARNLRAYRRWMASGNFHKLSIGSVMRFSSFTLQMFPFPDGTRKRIFGPH